MVVLNASIELSYLPPLLCSEMLNCIINFGKMLYTQLTIYTIEYPIKVSIIRFHLKFFTITRLIKINSKFSDVKFFSKQFRKKFSDTTLQGIFLGYDDVNHTAFKIFDPLNNKIILSRAVSFLENHPGNIASPSSPPDIVDFLRLY